MQYSVVNLNDVRRENLFFRIDAEYRKQEYIRLRNRIKQHESRSLRSVTLAIRKGIFDISPDKYQKDGIPFIRVQNIKNDFLEPSECVFISEESFQKEHKTGLEEGDIAISKVGTVGNVCLVMDKANTSQNVISVKVKKDTINPFYLFAYLSSPSGQSFMKQIQAIQVQSKLELHEVRNIQVPIFDDLFQNYIELTTRQSFAVKNISFSKYQEAQTFLLAELGLTNRQPKHQLAFVKNYSDAERAGRIDAEYFQPKYEEIVNAIKSYPGGWDRLENLVTVKKCVEVGSDEYFAEGIPFVRVSNLNPFEITEEKYISDELYETIRRYQPKKREILFSKDATPGIAHYLNERPPKMIPSGGILRLKNKTDKINNEYLTLVLNSVLTKEQVNRDVGGSVIFHWRPDQVKSTTIPILPKDQQTQIQQKVTESFNLRKQSKHLLDCAKRSVEIAIEQDEQTALDWLERETQATQKPQRGAFSK